MQERLEDERNDDSRASTYEVPIVNRSRSTRPRCFGDEHLCHHRRRKTDGQCADGGPRFPLATQRSQRHARRTTEREQVSPSPHRQQREHWRAIRLAFAIMPYRVSVPGPLHRRDEQHQADDGKGHVNEQHDGIVLRRARLSAASGGWCRFGVLHRMSRMSALALNPEQPPTAEQWSDWHWQMRHAIGSVDSLREAIALSDRELEGAMRAERQGLPIRITPYYLALADPRDPDCPVRRQCVPDGREASEIPGDLVDPLGEVAHEVAPRLIRRYPDRVLLLVTDRCAVYCRFCTRSRMVGSGDGPASLEVLAPALDWIRAHPEIRDVIVSGGDPFAMSTERLVRVVAAVDRRLP